MVSAGVVQLNFHIDPELKRRFKRYCIERDLSINEVLNAAVRSILEDGDINFMEHLELKQKGERKEKEKEILNKISNSWESSY
jgi:hypothetical protein